MQAQKRPATVEVRCTFAAPVDPAIQRTIRESLHEFLQVQPGYMRDSMWDRDGAFAWSAGLPTIIFYTSTWASDAQAVAAADQAHVWRDSNAGRFGWARCDITPVAERDD